MSDSREIKMDRECICGFRPPSDPNDDCERCRLIVEIARLRERCDQLEAAQTHLIYLYDCGAIGTPVIREFCEAIKAADAAKGE